MKKIAVGILFAVMLFSGCAGYKVSVMGVDVKALHNIEAKDGGAVALGIVASVVTHVAGHFIAAELCNVDIHLEGLTEVIDYSQCPSQDSIKWMARGGFIFQLAVNTALVELAPDSYFTKGFTGFTTVELLTYKLRHPDSGDFNLIDENEGNGSLEHALFLGWAAYNFTRLSVQEAPEQ